MLDNSGGLYNFAALKRPSASKLKDRKVFILSIRAYQLSTNLKVEDVTVDKIPVDR